MAHFGLISPAFYSHVAAVAALAEELIERGHRVTLIQQPDAASFVRNRRIGFHAVGHATHPQGTLAAIMRRAANPGSPAGLFRVIADMAASTDMLCRELPAALETLGIDAILADQMEAAGGLVAEALRVPFVSIACALPVNREPGVPLPVMPFGWGLDERTLKMVEGSTRVYDWMMGRHGDTVERHAQRLGLGKRRGLHEVLSPLAQISQTTAGFDWPRRRLPSNFHHVGPLRAVRRTGAPSTPDERTPLPPLDNKRPFIFASLGTMQGGRLALFERIARACRRIDAQLLVAHCGGLDARQEQVLKRAGADWVCAFADQEAAVLRADAIVSHGGLNTVLDAIAHRTPNLALPIAFDHPGGAARMVRAGAGLTASPRFAGPRTIARLLRRLLDDPGVEQRLAPLADEVRAAGGAPRAADIVEEAIGLMPAAAPAAQAVPHV